VERDRVVGYVAAMTDDEARTLWAEGRGNPLTHEQSRRAALAAKAAQLQAIPRDANGALGSMQAAADAINARLGNPQPARPQQPEPVQQMGFTANRAQGAAGGSDWAPINERDRNKQKISDILRQRNP
jgi:hypothetical protein